MGDLYSSGAVYVFAESYVGTGYSVYELIYSESGDGCPVGYTDVGDAVAGCES